MREEPKKPKLCIKFLPPPKMNVKSACLSSEKVRAQMAQKTSLLPLCFLDTSPDGDADSL